MIDKNSHLNEWRKQKELKREQAIKRLIEENQLLRSELNRTLEILAKPHICEGVRLKEVKYK